MARNEAARRRLEPRVIMWVTVRLALVVGAIFGLAASYRPTAMRWLNDRPRQTFALAMNARHVSAMTIC